MGIARARITSRSIFAAAIVAGTIFIVPSLASANVITDWDETATAIVAPMPPYSAQRLMAIVDVAMFDAVNSIERRYQPYLAQLAADPATSKEAAAAAAAATVLASIDPKTAEDMKAALARYLAAIPDGQTKSDGVKLGEAVAIKVMRRGRTTAPMHRMTIARGLQPASTYRHPSQPPRCGHG